MSSGRSASSHPFRQATLPEAMEEELSRHSQALPSRSDAPSVKEKIDLTTYETFKVSFPPGKR